MYADHELRNLIRARLTAFPRLALQREGRRAAAVAMVVTEAGYGPELAGLSQYGRWHSGPALVLTRRAAALRAHAGQWALPGGRLDPGETATDAALRELAEEVRLHLPRAAVLGVLDDYATRSGYVITPVVLWGGRASAMSGNPDEVHSIHRIPVTELLREDAPRLEPTPAGEHPVLRMPIGHSYIAAPTAALLYQFREVCLAGRDTRVAHFDQPQFAWR